MQKFNRRILIAGAASLGAGPALAQASTAAAPDLARFPMPSEPVPVAFLLDTTANVIDIAGPWEVFQTQNPRMPGFRMYTVAETMRVYQSAGNRDGTGLQLTPHFTFQDAPQPRVLVIGYQSAPDDPEKLAWIRKMAVGADVIMSVCTGAFVLANTGLLDGLSATTHHQFYGRFEQQFPAVKLVRGRRFVDNGKFVSAGGLTSGIDAALHVAARYYGEPAARQTASMLEHDSQGWINGLRAT